MATFYVLFNAHYQIFHSVFAAECFCSGHNTLMMSLRATINGYTAWANMRLVRECCEADNILVDIMQGPRMKVLVHC